MPARITNAQVMAALVALSSRLDTIAPARGSVAQSPVKVKTPTYATKAELAAGGGFVCASCGRHLRTAKRAAVCGDLVNGHLPR